MYKLLLCWKYLRTRTIALVSIISVTLGVATMIVVNSVMAGFSHEMLDRLHGILSDVVFEAQGLEGFPDPDWHMAQIRRVAGDDIQAMTPTVHVPAMLAFQHHGDWVTRQVQLIGVDDATIAAAGDFQDYLMHPANRERFSFLLHDDGYGSAEDAVPRRDVPGGWKHRRRQAEITRMMQAARTPGAGVPQLHADDPPPAEPTTNPEDPFANQQPQQAIFDPANEQHAGIVLGVGLGTYHSDGGRDHYLCVPGDDVKLTFPTAGTPPRALDYTFTVVDLWESKMSEYDATLAFVPISKLQELRGMTDPQSGKRFVTSIQIKLRPGVDPDTVRNKLRTAFAPEMYSISTWRDKQGPLLAAVQMETAILNVLLFMIIAVAGFGILAIFFMIVVEKTRDIGILKSLGASRWGILGIFLGYGLSLGIVGAGGGLALGLVFVHNINGFATLLGQITGTPVFSPEIYYFNAIPTIVDPFTVAWIVTGALLIAVLASVLPALRAALLHPVEALRYG